MTSPVIVKPDKAIKGNDFDFNSINDNNFLTVITSKLGMPPKVFWQFFYQLKMASKNPDKPLKGLQHCVYGNGDIDYSATAKICVV